MIEKALARLVNGEVPKLFSFERRFVLKWILENLEPGDVHLDHRTSEHLHWLINDETVVYPSDDELRVLMWACGLEPAYHEDGTWGYKISEKSRIFDKI